MQDSADPRRFALFPGLHGTAHLFEPFLAASPPAASIRILTYPTHQPMNWSALHRHVASELTAESNLILIAESFGGPLALQFAADHPQKVRALILCASFIRPPVPRLLCFLASPFIWSRFPIPGPAIRFFLAGTRAQKSLVTQTHQAIRSVSPRTLAHRVRLAARTNAQRALQQSRIPILYLAPTRDRLVGSRARRRIQSLRPEIAIKSMDTPHLLLQSKPKEAWLHITDFLNTLPTRILT